MVNFAVYNRHFAGQMRYQRVVSFFSCVCNGNKEGNMFVVICGNGVVILFRFGFFPAK